MTTVNGANATNSNETVSRPSPLAPEERKLPSIFDNDKAEQKKETKPEDTVKKNNEAKPEAAQKEDNSVKHTPHKVGKGFYPATADKNPKITTLLENNGEKLKSSDDPAGTIAEAVIGTKSDTADTAQMHNQIRQLIIKANPSVFEKDGSLKKDDKGNIIADLGKLDLPMKSHLLKVINKEDPKRTVVPKGFYPAFKDNKNTINGLTEHQIRENEGKAGNRTCGAVQVLNALLKTKGALATKKMSGERKIALLNDLIKKNPSVFDKKGFVKPDADLSKLDVPTIDYMFENYMDKDPKTPVTIARNGAYAVGKGKNAKFYQADGTELTPNEFKQRCPNLYKNITAA